VKVYVNNFMISDSCIFYSCKNMPGRNELQVWDYVKCIKIVGEKRKVRHCFIGFSVD
jgi:hypothetical protein